MPRRVGRGTWDAEAAAHDAEAAGGTQEAGTEDAGGGLRFFKVLWEGAVPKALLGALAHNLQATIAAAADEPMETTQHHGTAFGALKQ